MGLFKKENKSKIERIEPNLEYGLNEEEVKLRKEHGLVNVSKKVKGKSHLSIIFSSFFTFFNIILYALAFIFLMFQLFYPNGLKFIPITKYGFLFVILCNALTSIISQELSKRTVEKMKLISDPKANVLRNGETININVKDIVIDDLVILKTGNEVPCDLIIRKGEVYVNESMLTGESKALKKSVGEEILSGSFIVAGNAVALANKVGNDTFISSLESKVSLIKKKKSILMVNIYKIIKYLLIFLFPAVFLVGLKIYYVGVDGRHWVFTLDVITKSASTLVGMIPIGMILLSSITLSEAIIKLYRQKTMVQELYAIENLSRVTLLCLDKTGTLTTQNFFVDEVIKLKEEDIDSIMKEYLGAFNDDNSTQFALKKYFGVTTNITYKSIEPFSSEKKCSKVIFKNGDEYSLGAPDFIIKDKKAIELVDKYSKDGFRVLALTKNNEGIALFLLKDELRTGIKETLDYFSRLGVKIKIISGDNVSTIKEISKSAGVKDYENAISMEDVKLEDIKSIANEYTIFARTSPDQKQEIIKTLEEKGETVGYIGDGVNDTLSLRQADCSIALKSGADSTKAVSDVVLLDDDFSHLPSVLNEGRRVVVNIKRSILLFLTKSIFIGLFSIFSVFFEKGMPVEIESIYIYEFISVALCGFLLSIENNDVEADDGNFVRSVLTKALLFGLFMFISAIIPILINLIYRIDSLPEIITLNITISGLVILFTICRPFNKYTLTVFIIGFILSLLSLLAFPSIFLDPLYLKQANNLSDQLRLLKEAFFNFDVFYRLSYKEYLIPIIYLIIGYPLYLGLDKLINKLVTLIINKHKSRVNKKQKI